MPTQPQKRKISSLAIIAIILVLLALGMLFLIFAPGPRMRWALTMGEKYLTDCEYTQAVTMFSRAIRVDDRSEPAYLGRAEAYIQLDQPAAAVDDLTFVIDELTTDDADVYIQRAEAYTMLGDTDAARADLDTAASLGADTSEQTAQLDAMTRITVSLPTKIVNYDQSTGGPTIMQYNADGLLTDYTYVYRTGSSEHDTYDEHGNITSSAYGDSVMTYINTYDDDGRLLTHAAADGSRTETYAYDDHGNLIHHDPDRPMESGDATDCIYTYDDQGRITSSTSYLLGSLAGIRNYTYTDEDYTKESDYWVYGERTHTYSTYSLKGELRKEIVYTQYTDTAEYKSKETYCYLGKPFLTNYYNENGTIIEQEFWKCDFDTSRSHHIMLTEYHDVTQLESIGFERFRYDESRKEFADFGDDYGVDTVTYYTYTYDDDGNIIGRTAYTDGVLTEEITYTVMQVPKDYNFDIATEADYRYKDYVMVN